MKLREYLEHLQKIAGDPASLEMEVITSADDEGNYFKPVFYQPSMGHYNHGEFNQNKPSNSICLN